MNPLDLLFGQIKNTISSHSSPNTPGPSYDANPLLGALAGAFSQHASNNNQQFGVDPQQYGDPNDFNNQYGNVLDASQDPLGDPADQEFGNVKDASQDPYGDPADGR